MLVFLDRNQCKHWQSGCEACFAGHLRRKDFHHSDCLQSVVYTQRPENVFTIRDRDQSLKTLIVKQENMQAALSSWVDVWEQQAGPVI